MWLRTNCAEHNVCVRFRTGWGWFWDDDYGRFVWMSGYVSEKVWTGRVCMYLKVMRWKGMEGQEVYIRDEAMK